MLGTRSSVVDWVTVLQPGRSQVRFPMRWIFFNWPNPSSRIMVLDVSQPYGPSRPATGIALLCPINTCWYFPVLGRAITQAVSFLPQQPGFEPRSGHVGFVVDTVALGKFFRVLRFPLRIVIPGSLSIIRGGYNRPISGRRAEWTQLDSTPH
jgi:hypothetical protein